MDSSPLHTETIFSCFFSNLITTIYYDTTIDGFITNGNMRVYTDVSYEIMLEKNKQSNI